MGKTGIEWTDVTWNPTRGCSRVSEGCRNCYAERMAARFSTHSYQDGDTPGGPFAGFAVMTPSGPRWTGRVELIPERLEDPLHWRKPRRVFVNSMSDLWHERLPLAAIAKVYAVMGYCYRHTFQVLTKRPENRRQAFTMRSFDVAVKDEMTRLYAKHGGVASFPFRWPLRNVWEGVSVEDQPTADARIPLLLQTPVAVRFVSYEPALSGVDFSRYLPHNPVYEKQAERGIRLRGGGERGSSDSGRRDDLANTETRLGSLEEAGSEPSLQESKGGARLRRVLPGTGDDRQAEGLCPGPPSGVETLQGSDPGRLDNQPHGRREEAKPSRQSGTGEPFGTAGPCDPRAEGRSRLQPGWDQELHGEADGRRGQANPGEACFGREAIGNRGGLRDRVSDGLQNSERRSTLDLIIVGGESGPGARPFDIAWARSVIEQCRAAGVACFVKQLGAQPRGYSNDRGLEDRLGVSPFDSRKGGNPLEWPKDLRVREFPEVRQA